MVFQGILKSPLKAMEICKERIMEYREALKNLNGARVTKTEAAELKLAGKIKRWERPKFGTLKVNCDAAWNQKSKT